MQRLVSREEAQLSLRSVLKFLLTAVVSKTPELTLAG
jgi:hypothetical protein